LVYSYEPSRKLDLEQYIANLQEKDESGVLYNYIISLKLYKIDLNLTEAYKYVNRSNKDFQNLGEKEQKKILNILNDHYESIDSLTEKIENQAFLVAQNKNSLDALWKYSLYYNNPKNKNLYECSYLIDSLFFTETTRANNLFSYRKYLNSSKYLLLKVKATRKIDSIEQQMAMYILNQSSSGAYESLKDSFDYQSVWLNKLKVHYINCRWTELNNSTEISKYEVLLKDMESYDDIVSKNKGLIEIKKNCKNSIGRINWLLVKQSADEKILLEFIKNPESLDYLDSAMFEVINLIKLSKNLSITDELLTFCEPEYKQILEILRDEIIWGGYTSKIAFLKEQNSLSIYESYKNLISILSELKTTKYSLEVVEAINTVALEYFKEFTTVDEYVDIMVKARNFLNDDIIRHFSSVYKECHPYDSTLVPIIEKSNLYRPRNIDKVTDIGFNYSPKMEWSEGGISASWVGSLGFVVKDANGNNYASYNGIQFKKKLGNGFYLFTNCQRDVNSQNSRNAGFSGFAYSGEDTPFPCDGNDFILYFDPTAKFPLKFVSSLNLERGEDIEIFLPPCYNRLIKQSIVRLTSNDRDSDYKDLKGLYLIDQSRVILPKIYTDVIAMDVIYRGEKQLMLKLVKDDMIGLATIDGKIVIKPVFKNLIIEQHGFNRNNQQIIEYNGKFGIINRDFEIVLDAIYEEVKILGTQYYLYAVNEQIPVPLSSGSRYVVSKTTNSVWKVYNSMSAKFYPSNYGSIDVVGNFYIVSKTNNFQYKYFIDQNFNLVYSPPNNIKIGDCRMGEDNCLTWRGWIDNRNTWGLIFLKEKKLVTISSISWFSSLGTLSSNRILFIDTGNKYGFLDRNGNVVIKPIYDYASYFYNDIATVSLYGQSFKIDKSGKKIN
jgi:hypothetical protein